MEPHQAYRLGGTIPHRDEEEIGLLNGKEEEWSTLSDIEELDGEDEIESTERVPPRRKSWLRISIISLLVAWTLGFVIHSFVAPGRMREPSTALSPRLRPEEDYILAPDWDFEAKPTTREYHWTIAEHDLNPDGVYRRMILINEMFPGPLIECNEGDEIIVHVHNRGSNATSIHWHGLYQNGTNWMDGTVGISQCPIAPGKDFTYRSTVTGQSGTYWYHSHMAVQASDGVVGPFIIHSRQERSLQQLPYSIDRILLLSDHYYDLSSQLAMDYLKPDSENSEPVPSSAVINGRNMRDCSTLPSRNCSSVGRTNALIDLPTGSNARLRIINVGAFAEFQLQIDEHSFRVSEVDGTDVWQPEPIHRLNINPAQRYSIILTPPKPETNKGLYWIRARMVTHCFAYENPELEAEVRGVVRYAGDSLSPDSKDWSEIIEVECKDLDTSSLIPTESIAAPEQADDLVYLRSSFQIRDWRLSRGYLNDSSYRPSISSPSLNRVIEGYDTGNATIVESLAAIGNRINDVAFNAKNELVYQTASSTSRSSPPVIDILIQNFDDGNHPFHLHGYKFFVLASGHGYAPHPVANPAAEASDLYSNIDLSNPLRRDTVSVEAFGWALIRFVADNPGLWSFHCHISWHAEAGLLMQFLVQPDVMSRWKLPGEVTGLCKDEGIERGKGPEDGIWEGTWE
ncbi:multicopper oxidase [Lophiostoma macrostomum CBS 122681]|uniref:Multicopper oxidase n=1 Tax=Lophiostoma macrostomum CBS 122681 TaxID=1314788 RepID=A0A6A6TH82_9PLEO|nr:multicopper oxidase [Lophiostoma macrostomum CBS 122681]